MDRLSKAIETLHILDSEASEKDSKSVIHPLIRLLVTIIYVLFVVSVNKYDMTHILGLMIFLIVMSSLYDISLIDGISRMRHVLILLFLLGIVNPIFDRTEMGSIMDVTITGGMISMITLWLKSVMSVMAAYILMMTTGITGICAALYTIKVPKGAITVLMLMYRYIIVFLKEIKRMNTAYKMRAPLQKGINIKAWGSFVGLLLLRTTTRAENVYQSMEMRGYGEKYFEIPSDKKSKNKIINLIYLCGWTAFFIIVRFGNIFSFIEKIIF